MKKVSSKQQRINSTIAQIKKKMQNKCVICGRSQVDLAHLLPKSIYPEHYTKEWNLVPLCRSCHYLFDNDKNFRSKQVRLMQQVQVHDELAAHRHFAQ